MLGLVKPPCEEASVLAAPERPKQLPRRTWVLIVAILGSSMAFIDGTVVNLALPRIQTDLQATIAQAQWVIEAYTLFLAALIITGGSLGDHRGHRTIFTFGVAVFAIASTACGLASTAGALIGARAVQGVGAALLVPGSLALISSAFPQEERGQAIGIWSAFTSITTAAGPVLAGWFVEHLSWRWVFYINLPTAVVIILLIALKVPECGVRNSEQLDWPGSALTILGFGGIVFGFIQSAPLVGVLGAFALAIFFVVEAQSSQPMLPLRLFRSRNFLGANLLTFFLYAGLSAVTFFLPLDLIQIQGYTPTQAGFALLPFILIVSVLSRWSGKAATKVGSRLLLIVGPAVASLGFALLALAPKGASYGTGLLPAMAFMGLGFAISIAPLTTTVMNALDLNHVGIASGVNNMVSRVAGLLAIAVLGAVMTGTFNGHLDRKLNSLSLSESTRHQIRSEQAKLAGIETTDPQIRKAIVDAFVAGYRTVVLIAALLGLVSVITAVLFIRNDPRQSPALSGGGRSG